jgi:hypothetical protein
MRSHICSTFKIFLILWRGIEPPLAQSGKSDEQRYDERNSQTYEGYKTKTVEIIFPQILKDAGEDAYVIGEIVESEDKITII